MADMATTFRLAPEIHRRAILEAERRGLSLNSLVSMVLTDFFDQVDRRQAELAAYAGIASGELPSIPPGPAVPANPGPPGRLPRESKMDYRMRLKRWKDKQ